MTSEKSIFKKDIIGWSLYDFANTIYSMNIISLYLKRYIVEDLGKDDRYFDIPYALSMLAGAILLPALGAMSDHSTRKKIFLFLFTSTCCLATGIIPLIPITYIGLMLIIFGISNFAYEAGMPFYNSLLYSVADGKRARYISGIGVAFGYVGSIVGMIIVLPFVTGSIFGVEIPFLEGGGKTASFIPTALLFFIFSLPLFLWVRERPVERKEKTSIVKAYKDVWEGITATKKYPGVLRFLIADYFFEDAVTTVIMNIGIYCSIVIGFSEGNISLFLIISTFSAVVGSFIIGKLSEHWSLKYMLNVIVIGWIICLTLFIVTDYEIVVWILGSIVGILLGGLWTTSRPFLGELVPKSELGRFFGLFSLSGRAAAVVGPLIWTTTVYFFQPNRYLGQAVIDIFEVMPENHRKLPYKMGIISLVFMMTIGLAIFKKVPHTQRKTNE
jgi:UMF1 family MFS transporter